MCISVMCISKSTVRYAAEIFPMCPRDWQKT